MNLPPGVTVARSLEEVEPVPSAVTIGNFDGVHRGHRVLLRRAVGAVEGPSSRSVVVTFDPHPAAVLRPGSEPPALQRLEDRIAALTQMGVQLVLVLPFTRELSALSPADFVHRVLVERLRAERVIVGTNFRFGHRAAGDVVTLVEEGERHGFVAEAVTLLELDGVAISSSSIREHLERGDVDWAARALGRPHQVAGEVVVGDGRGRTIGVPTANVAVPSGLQLPGDGVYAGHVVHRGVRYPAITNVGMRPTFQGTTRTVESHLLGAEIDLYGDELEVHFEHRVRGERRFDDATALVAQIRSDIATAEAALGL